MLMNSWSGVLNFLRKMFYPLNQNVLLTRVAVFVLTLLLMKNGKFLIISQIGALLYRRVSFTFY